MSEPRVPLLPVDEARRIAGHRRSLARMLRREGIPYLEIASLTESSGSDNQALFGERIHPNRRGHRVMAEALIDLLAEHQLLRGVSLKIPDRPDTGLR